MSMLHDQAFLKGGSLMKSKLRFFSIFIVLLTFPLVAGAQVEVDPSEDFGDVLLGEYASAVITIQNLDFIPITIDLVYLEPAGGDFAITEDPMGTTLEYGQSADVMVTFTPSDLGAASATLEIGWVNGGTGTAFVELTGVGVSEPGEPTSVQDILDFFDQSVADGSLVGNGLGNSADGRRKALRNKVKAAGDIIQDGGEACEQLWDAFQRCDGLPRPPEFVAGSAAPVLAEMILALMGELGCQ
jgi:hypothetical protein